MKTQEQGCFDFVVEFPDADALRNYQDLVGLDDLKARLQKEGTMTLDPNSLESWGKKFACQSLVSAFKKRLPLFIFAGDVGTGKSALAKSFGDDIARARNASVSLYGLSLMSRGSGAVGEMTSLISAAFAEVRSQVSGAKLLEGGYRHAAILLIDEADALAQSRETQQMHHEDRAGVNALIRGIDSVADSRAPVLTVLCTNRLSAIDPAVRRRASAIFEFVRPNALQRLQVIGKAFTGLNFTTDQLKRIAEVTGETSARAYGYTYSDLTHRLIPDVVIDAFPNAQIRFERVMEIAQSIVPTPTFNEAAA